MAQSSDLETRIQAAGQRIQAVLDAAGATIVGQRTLLKRMIMGLLCEGHVLLEGMPGLAKSLMVKTLADTLDASFQRIQFTPDLLPADLTGTQIFHPKDQEFHIRKGPVFANIVLADEVNRAPPKVQSALLEAMQEKQVTLAGQTLPLPDPFVVLATQNPIEHEGTYPLPEAQVDRFLFKVEVPYPSRDEEIDITLRMAGTGLRFDVEPVMKTSELIAFRAMLNEIHVDDKVRAYAVDLVLATRDPEAAGIADLEDLIRYGASPRASIALILAARARALIEGRTYVIPKDIKQLATDVLRHRLILSFEAEARGLNASTLVGRVLEGVEVP